MITEKTEVVDNGPGMEDAAERLKRVKYIVHSIDTGAVRGLGLERWIEFLKVALSCAQALITENVERVTVEDWKVAEKLYEDVVHEKGKPTVEQLAAFKKKFEKTKF